MKLEIGQTSFPSTPQRSIWHAAVFMSPFYPVLPEHLTATEAEELREGEESFYNFMVSLYEDMYEHPKDYYIPVEEYDQFMNGRQRQELNKRDATKESRLRNKFQRAIQFYQKILFDLGVKGRTLDSGDCLVIDEDVLYDVILRHNLRIVRGEERKRLNALTRMGLEIEYVEGKIHLFANQNPKMFQGLTALCQKSRTKYGLTHFLRCDFRGLLKGHQLSFEDAVVVLPKKLQKMAYGMDEFMKSMDCKITVQPLKNTTLGSQWKATYLRKGKSLYGFHADTESLHAFAYFNKHKHISRMGYHLKEKFDGLFNWFYENIPERTCSCPNNRKVDIGGRHKRICGLMNRMEVPQFDEENISNLKQIIQLLANN